RHTVLRRASNCRPFSPPAEREYWHGASANGTTGPIPLTRADMRTIDWALRIALSGAHKLLKLGWFVRRPRTYGAHALALTPERKVILVKLRYAAGWRLPGGGCRPDEPADQAVVRELREEIGMGAHGAVRFACELDEEADFKQDLASLLVVEGVY